MARGDQRGGRYQRPAQARADARHHLDVAQTQPVAPRTRLVSPADQPGTPRCQTAADTTPSITPRAGSSAASPMPSTKQRRRQRVGQPKAGQIAVEQPDKAPQKPRQHDRCSAPCPSTTAISAANSAAISIRNRCPGIGASQVRQRPRSDQGRHDRDHVAPAQPRATGRRSATAGSRHPAPLGNRSTRTPRNDPTAGPSRITSRATGQSACTSDGRLLLD